MQKQAILFADQVGSTKLLAQIGDEAMVAVHNRLWSIFTSVVARHDGEVLSDEGDGGSAVFDNTTAAALAALDMLDECKQPEPTHAASIDLRVAIHSGPVIRTAGAAVGLAVHLTARLCDQAPAGFTLISDQAAADLVNHHELRITPFGQRSAKGIDQPFAVNVLTRAADPVPTSDQQEAPTSFRSSPLLDQTTTSDHFVGRDTELDVLEQSLARAAAGSPGIVLIEGVPGTGKSTLTRRLATTAIADGAVCLVGRSDEALDDPFHEIIEMLHHTVAEAPLPLLADHVVRNGSLLTRLLPSLGDRVPSASLSDQAPAPDHRLLFAAVADLIRSLARHQPVVLVLEDAHWASSSSLELFRFLLRDAGLGPVLLVVTYRAEEIQQGSPASRFVSMVSDEPNASSVSLRPFDIASVTDLCRVALDIDDDVLVELGAALHRDTGGNPLFCWEMLRTLQSDARVTNLTADTVRSVLDVPRSVQDLALRRVKRLGHEVEEVLTDAAVLGETFDFLTLRRIAATSPLSALDAAERVELIRADDVDGQRYTFGHALVQRALYDAMSTAARLGRHRDAADAHRAVHRGVTTNNASEILHHLQNAGVLAESGEIAEAAAVAAEAAEAKLALNDAIRLRQLVVATVDDDGAGPSITARAWLELGRVQTAALHTASRASMANAAAAAAIAGDWDLHAAIAIEYGGALKENQARRQVAEPVELIETSLQHHTEPGPVRSRLLISLAVWQRQHWSYAERRPFVDEAMSGARSINDPRQLAGLLADHHRALHGPNVAAEALVIADELSSLSTQLGDDAVRFQALYVRLIASVTAGSWDQAKATGAQIEDVGHRLRNIEGRRIALMWRTVQAQIAGDIPTCRALIAELAELLEHYPPEEWIRFMAVFNMPGLWLSGRFDLMYQQRNDQDPQHAWTAWFAAESGRHEEAEHHLDLALPPAEIERKSDYLWWLEAVGTTRAASALGRSELAAEMYDVMLPYRSHNAVLGLACFLGTAEHHLGTLSAAQEHFDLAVDHFERAIDRYTSMEAMPFIGLAQAELGNVLVRRGRPEDAAWAADLRQQAKAVAQSHQFNLIANTLDSLEPTEQSGR